MTMKPMRAVLYLRVSTDDQTTDNQREDLERVAQHRGWTVTGIYEDAGISGSKGRDKRPGLDSMMKDASRGKFDVIMAWKLDRLGRSLQHLLDITRDLDSAHVALYMHGQDVDTTTAAGRFFYQVMGAVAEFERGLIQARVKAGMDRAKAEQDAGKIRRGKDGQIKKLIGRPSIAPKVYDLIRASLEAGIGINRTAATLGVGNAVVQRIKAELKAA